MREVTKCWFRIGAFACVCATAHALTLERTTTEYDSIARKNIFRLKEPEVVKTPDPPVAPLGKVFLTGITARREEKLAFLKTQSVVKPGGPATDQNLMMKVGQREGDIELLEIDEKSGRVKINHAGAVIELTFDKDAPKSIPAGNVGAPNSPAPNPSTAQPGPIEAPNPTVAPPPATYPAQRKFPGRAATAAPPMPPSPVAPAQLPTSVPPSGSTQLSPEEEQQLLNALERSNPPH